MGIPFCGMTGKFHHSWGEMGGYKTAAALDYECAAMLAQGAALSVGDHLHPSGAVDPSAMDLIAPAFAHAKTVEPWCTGSVNRAEIALMSVEAVGTPPDAGEPSHGDAADDGAARVLLESGFTFNIVDAGTDLSPYRLVILPDEIPVDAALEETLKRYLADGGHLLLSGQSGIDPERGMLFDCGASWDGPSPFSGGDYILPVEDLRAPGIAAPLYAYLPSQRLRPGNGESLGAVHDPYFDRTPRHFSGHLNTPPRPEPSPFILGSTKDGVTRIAHPLFSAYHHSGAVRLLEVAEAIIAKALAQPRMIRTSLPRAGRVTLRHQPAEGRDVLHLLCAFPLLRGEIGDRPVQPVQDLVRLMDIDVDMEVCADVAALRQVPEGTAIGFTQQDGRLRFTLPEMTGHAMVEVLYEK